MTHKPRQATIISETRLKTIRPHRNQTFVPFLRLRGRWLEQAGFFHGDSVNIHVEDGKLVITHGDEEL